MKRSMFVILLLLISFYLKSEPFLELFTIKGYVSDNEELEFFDNLPVTIYPNLADTTEKYTVYTNSEGFYFFSGIYTNPNEALIVVKGYCDGWYKYKKHITLAPELLQVNFNICHTPNWYIKQFIIKGQVMDTVLNLPVANQPLFFTNGRSVNSSSTVKTNELGYYADTFFVNIFDSLDFKVGTYTYEDRVPHNISYDIREPYVPVKEVDFKICSEFSTDWLIGFYHRIFVSQDVFFFEFSSKETDSVIWDLGDGTTGKGKTIHHKYPLGSYFVTMTSFLDGNKNVYSKRIIVGPSVYLGGKVFASETPVKNGYIMATTSDYNLIDITEIKNGSFYFDKILKGEYYFYAIPELNIDTLHFPKYISSYHNGQTNWQQVEVFDVNKNTSDVVINLNKNENVYYGKNNIKVFAEIPLIKKYEIVNIVLYNNQEEAIGSLYLKDIQEKTFNNLPDGIYYLNVEAPGILSNYIQIKLSSNRTRFVKFFLSNNSIDYLVTEISENNFSSIQIYPNPFEDYLIVKSDKSSLNLEIFDINGNLLFSEKIIPNEQLQTSNFEKGIYFAVLKDNENIISKKIIIKN